MHFVNALPMIYMEWRHLVNNSDMITCLFESPPDQAIIYYTLFHGDCGCVLKNGKRTNESRASAGIHWTPAGGTHLYWATEAALVSQTAHYTVVHVRTILS